MMNYRASVILVIFLSAKQTIIPFSRSEKGGGRRHKSPYHSDANKGETE